MEYIGVNVINKYVHPMYGQNLGYKIFNKLPVEYIIYIYKILARLQLYFWDHILVYISYFWGAFLARL